MSADRITRDPCDPTQPLLTRSDNVTVAYINRRAKALRKQSRFKHMQCLEIIAMSMGFANYHEAQRTLKDPHHER